MFYLSCQRQEVTNAPKAVKFFSFFRKVLDVMKCNQGVTNFDSHVKMFMQ